MLLHCIARLSQAGCINGGLPPVIRLHPTTSNWPNVQMPDVQNHYTVQPYQKHKCLDKQLQVCTNTKHEKKFTYTKIWPHSTTSNWQNVQKHCAGALYFAHELYSAQMLNL